MKKFLEQLGVDMATRVSLVVATHWHDDHIGGFGALYEVVQLKHLDLDSLFDDIMDS